MGLIDIHTHIIPDVDDGAKKLDDSIETISFLAELGIDTIIATPHRRSELFNFDSEKVKDNFNKLNNLILEKGLNTKIYLGAEYLFGPDLFEDISNNQIYTLGPSKYILVEFSNLKFSNQDKENLFRILTKGYKIVVAHIERYRFNSDSFHAIEYLRDNSVLLQCDIMSLAGLWGEQSKLFMQELIKRNYVDILSTDVHCKHFEKNLLKEGFEVIREIDKNLLERYMGFSLKKKIGLL